jgi:hypothetical protein
MRRIRRNPHRLAQWNLKMLNLSASDLPPKAELVALALIKNKAVRLSQPKPKKAA